MTVHGDYLISGKWFIAGRMRRKGLFRRTERWQVYRLSDAVRPQEGECTVWYADSRDEAAAVVEIFDQAVEAAEAERGKVER